MGKAKCKDAIQSNEINNTLVIYTNKIALVVCLTN